MKKIRPIAKHKLYHHCPPKQFAFQTTKELTELKAVIGQERALRALHFGTDIKQPGFNLYVLGPAGIGKHKIIKQVLSKTIGIANCPDDWCYVYNFENPRHPLSLRLKSGFGKQFSLDMKVFIENLWQQIQREHENMLQEKSITIIVNSLLKELKIKYNQFSDVIAYLKNVEEDIIQNSDIFTESYDLLEQETPKVICMHFFDKFNRYKVNVLISHDALYTSFPIIYEDNPTYKNLIGHIEYVAKMGALITDFTLIHAGSLHRANGGYLLVDAAKLLAQPYSWEALKRSLFSGKVQIESQGESYDLISTISLVPEPIPLDLKIILIGDHSTYYLLCDLDPDFAELFKVIADFNEDIERNSATQKLYAEWLTNFIVQNKLRHLDRRAVARIIEYASRIIEDAEKLSLHMRSINDLLSEADYWAGKANHSVIKLDDIEKAIAEEQYRANRVKQEIYEEIHRGDVLIATKGETIGQINALTVLSIAGFHFGIPNRVSATARIGKGDIINIERETAMSGEIHTKGMLIIIGFLMGRYAQNFYLSLAGSIVFEQNYNEVEGDSASVAEICVLLSAITNIPIKQYFAITGSMNQHGEVQAIGGVNDKVEAFFDICRTQGLTGEQAVIIPAANVKNLMLKKEVINAVVEKKFQIFAIHTVDEAIELLTGIPAGTREEDGHFPKGSFNAITEKRLIEFARRLEGERKL